MTISPLAGKPAPKDMLVDLAQLEREYYERPPDVEDPNQLVRFGTSGHRASPMALSSRPRTTHRRTVDSSTIRPTAARLTPTSRNGSRAEPTSCCARAPA